MALNTILFFTPVSPDFGEILRVLKSHFFEIGFVDLNGQGSNPIPIL
jgi:hypothetical protein